jgi:glycosyltransferase involved in cell wall biosynthesis
MGRHAAGHGFLRAYLRSSGGGERWVYAPDRAAREAFQKYLPLVPAPHRARMIGPENLSALAEPGCLYIPGPGLAEAAWRRRIAEPFGWSLCGVTHTVSSAGAMDVIAGLVAAPVGPWDALVCTSKAAREVVRGLWEGEAADLRARLGAKKFAWPELPVIPLGVDCGQYAFTPEERAKARAALGLVTDDVAILFLGRLSFHAKAHPLAMYRALEMSTRGRERKGRVVLIECGWHANDFIANAFTEARRHAAPSIGHVLLDGRQPESARQAWAAADIFCSLSDNIQESFGLAPIEAMAAGLPSVVTDWNGYRDTVRDGRDGFRVPIVMPAPGTGSDLAARHALGLDTYDQYIGFVAQLVAPDGEAAAHALARLIDDPKLRARLGANARTRARETFDWQVVLGAYRALWRELAEKCAVARRKTKTAARDHIISNGDSPAARGWPARPDPFALFAGYASATLGARTRLARGRVSADELKALRRLAMVDYAKAILPADETVARILAAVPAVGAATFADVRRAAGAAPPEGTARAVAWLLKMGVLKVVA